MIKEIKKGNNIIALLIDHAGMGDVTQPITDPAGALQILAMKRNSGHEFDKHTHKIMERSNNDLQEAIVVTKGKLLINICDRNGNDVDNVEVSAGQCLFLANGGFGIEVLEDSEFFEFKNGPHTEDKILL